MHKKYRFKDAMLLSYNNLGGGVMGYNADTVRNGVSQLLGNF
jgi:hypothetical protein